MRTIIHTLAALGIAAASQAALAAPDVQYEAVRIHVDEDATPAQVYTEIHKQARRACESRAIYPHRQLKRELECKKRIVDDAVAAFDRPNLTALHRERSGVQTGQLADAGRN
jgi:UrcA family protein